MNAEQGGDTRGGAATAGDATGGGAITRFQDQYGFLSNFSASWVVLDGEGYPTVEHAYQAAKAERDQVHLVWVDGVQVPIRWRVLIARAPTPGRAKRAGRQIPLREGWDAIKLDIMRELLLQKFAPGRQHLTWLLMTGDRFLIEGNQHGDQFWGVVNGVGKNHLGKLLMAIRTQRRREGSDARA